MNNNDFSCHFINACEYIGINDYENIIYKLYPVIEEGKNYNSTDDIMRLVVLPKPRKCTFDDVIKMFTWKEGFYPLWIKIMPSNDMIILKVSLRMRKAGINDDKRFYPFLTEDKNKDARSISQ